ncbi:UNVERIFIED_CONTAM: hypothetical protein FKN15_013335 [Acipenser sinensis]
MEKSNTQFTQPWGRGLHPRPPSTLPRSNAPAHVLGTASREGSGRQHSSRKPPVIKQRGFYSDVIAPGAAPLLEPYMEGPEVHQSLLCQTGYEQHLPKATTFRAPEHVSDEKPHGPSTEVLHKSDFPLSGYTAKVQLPFDVTPGHAPRKIEIERRRQKYLSLDIYELLKDQGIDSNKLMPRHHDSGTQIIIEETSESPPPVYLPLEVFDDEEFDCRTPSDWLCLGVEPGSRDRKPIPGKALLPHNDVIGHATTFRAPEHVSDEKPHGPSTEVLHKSDFPLSGYTAKVQLPFDVTPGHAPRKIEIERRRQKYLSLDIYELLKDQGIDSTQRVYWVPRIQLAFSAEDPCNFVKRVMSAHRRRQRTEALLLYNLYVDCMPVDGRRSMDKDSLQRIKKRAITTPGLRQNLIQDCLDLLEKEIVIDYNRTMNKICFNKVVTSHREQFSYITVPKTRIEKVPEKGFVDVPDYPFAENRKAFCFTSLLTKPETIAAASKVRAECNKVAAMSLFHVNLTKCLRLEEFEQTQSQAYSQVQLFLKDSWVNTLKNGVRSSLHDVGKGWYSLHESRWEVYRMSKLYKLMERIKFSLQDSLRFLVQDSLVNFTQLLLDACHSVLRCPDDMDWGSDLINSPFKPKRNPLFFVDLVLDKSGVHFSTPKENFERSLLALFDKGILATHNVPQLQKLVLKNMFISGVPLLESVGLHEPPVEELRESIRSAVRKALIPLSAYAKQYERHLELSNMDIDHFIKLYIKQERTIQDVKKDVYMHLAEKELLDNTLPSSIIIGPFLVNVDTVRQGLSKKRKALANAILDQLACKLRKQIEAACDECKAISRKLYEKPNSIEELAELREWMKGVPEQMKLHEMLVAGFSAYTDVSRAHEVANEVRRVSKQLKESQQLAQLYNNRERLFGMPVTNYDKLPKLIKDFQPFRDLWTTTSDWLRWHESWMNDPLTTIDPEQLEKNVSESFKTMHKCVKLFKDIPACQDVATDIRGRIEEFRPYIPLIQGLRNPGMRNRHWELLSESIQMNIKPKANFTFSRCLELKLQDHIEAIAKVAEVAGKEYAIEQALDKMLKEWSTAVFEVLPYKETGTFILKSPDEASQLLDDHIVMTQSMSFSPFKKPFEGRISTWESKLRITQDVLEEWLTCQRSWLYLEPIFSSEDINRQLPVESKRYQTMERTWKKIMKNTNENRQIIELCPDPRLLENLRECNKLLELVQKGLSEYLETKRGAFPRFYFLSDDELLEILSQTKDPTAVQPHLRKCFENVARLKFQQDLKITHMYSAEGEEVELFKPVYPSGNVEDWLLEVEKSMKASVRDNIERSLKEYPKKPRTEWVLSWPGQVVIAGCQTFWTAEVSEALEMGDLTSRLYPVLGTQLNDLVALVRGKLSKMQRAVLSALIVIEVHAKDVAARLVEENVQSVNDFEWISQLRYYWTREDLYIRAVNAEFLYGYEYLGNSGRLVITPLTDRCYLTLTGALHLRFGGAPAGPAGTGKTETTKDLGKALAIQTVVFNCSDQLDFMAMGKFLKGLASSGAWACFDEFNRIDVEVLSVVAQQITTIQKAQQQRVERFVFEGVEIPLVASCAVFITMNPGYAGRTELPDNLKALFRPVAMMVPDYAMIAEISLYSFGFNNAKVLSKKITTTFKLSSEQLSSQMLVAGFSAYTDISRAHEVANEVRRVSKQLKESQQLAQLYNNRERLFGMPVTNYDKLPKLVKDFQPFRDLWTTTSDWLRWHESWMNDPLTTIDPEQLEKNVSESFKTMHKCVKLFKDIPACQDVATDIRGRIEEFRPYIPLIQGLRNPGMRNRHWELLSESIQMNIKPKANFTFSRCLELKLQDHIEAIAKVAEVAGKEYAIEQALDKMLKEWSTAVFEVLPYKETGTFILKSPDEASQLLDDHIVMTQSMSFSPFKKPFEGRISTWESKLRITQDVLEEWLTCQRSWLYLEPIFSSEDINRQLPVESKRYQTMERTWKKIMKNTNENRQIIELCPDPRLLENLRECNKLLELVQKGLSEYLETKRGAFPRFYFLSDDELLEILSQTKDPTAVQPHLRKCFENVARLKFQQDLKITHMYSAEGEEVELFKPVYPSGNVEDWLLEVEKSMKASVRDNIERSLKEYPKKPRTEWVLSWPGQVVIAGCQTFWTAEVSEALEKGDLTSRLYPVLGTQLNDLVALVRGKLSKMQRAVLSALIVIEVHAKDVAARLVEENVQSVNDFEWISQLRYYWTREDLYIRAVNAEFLYGYEYLGNSGRLVITPLTDRCYLTLTGALHLRFGGAPAGPAGTGKTETTKDLGKALAIQTVVFNCSDQLDFMAMGKFLKGLASSGAWACFDEFNRIDVEVLSVVAQQITTIQKAQQQRVERFVFEGVEIPLVASCAVFITMNPGYAGRTELPDNLKALFRPVAMMVPDYAMIAEISLYSFGFNNAKVLSKKITTTFKLSSEQLSSQDHYDFGMRAVKTVISAAGNLKRENPTMNECYEVLGAALTALKGQPSVSGGTYEAVYTSILNPKSITMGQLYGEFDLLTHEWTDGILSSLIRGGASASDPDKKWYMFDGPVDAVWIENMNTVLDDNKKLCLSSGEIIKLTDVMTMMFEVQDLAVASPATVSRCGMVYLEPSILGLKPFTECWLRTIPEIMQPFTQQFIDLFDKFLQDSIAFVRKSVKEVIASTDSNLVCSMLRILDCFFQPFVPKEGVKGLPQEKLARISELIESWVIFSLVWSVGATGDANSNVGFSKWLRDKMKEEGIMLCFPDEGQVHDYRLNDAGISSKADDEDEEGGSRQVRWVNWMESAPTVVITPETSYSDIIVPTQDTIRMSYMMDMLLRNKKPVRWVNWMESAPTVVITPETSYSDIIVPTQDTIRMSYMMDMLLRNKKPVLCIGPTGTGKTLTVSDKLLKNMPQEYVTHFLMFSARTSANQTQDFIDSKLDKRRKGVFGPPLGKYFIFFIDDLNMPALETYGAQPPIELLRQWMDHRGWYDRKQIGTFKQLVDINFACAMGPPGGGRNPITSRFSRHFNFLSFTEMEDSSKLKIFSTILGSWMGVSELQSLNEPLVSATIKVYSTISAQLLPTPAKSHYTFNLRDLSKVFQGILMADVTNTSDKLLLLRLWYHESCRVFQEQQFKCFSLLTTTTLTLSHPGSILYTASTIQQQQQQQLS